MLSGRARRARTPPQRFKSLAALLRARGMDEQRDGLAVRLVDRNLKVRDSASYAELYERSLGAAQALRDGGVQRGSTVMLLLESCLEFYYALFGALAVGAVPVAVYPPLSKKTLSTSLRHLHSVANELSVAAVCTSEALLPISSDLSSLCRILLIDPSKVARGGSLEIEEDSKGRSVLLQYTSGSLGRPKAIELTTENIFENLFAIGDAFDMQPGDSGFSWLPLYHDMGLHSIFFDLMFRMPLTLMSPLDFLSHPSAWLRAISTFGISHSPAPSFGYSFAARRVRDRDLAGVDVSCWKVAMCGAEPIDHEALSAFANRFEPFGFDRRAFMAAYGLAENTVAVSFAPPRTGLRVDRLDTRPLRDSGRAIPLGAGDHPERSAYVDVVSVGKVIVDHQVRIVDAEGHELVERRIGEIQVCGKSRMKGYRGDTEATSASFDGDWLRTGDLGYVAGGELYVTGRSKDLIIRGGRNYHPQDIEAAASSVEGIRTGSVAAFGLPSAGSMGERLVVVAEASKAALGDPARTKQGIRMAVNGAVGVSPNDVVLVEKGVVPKTTSGKLQRAECRRLYLTEQLKAGHTPAWELVRIGLFSVLPTGLQLLYARLRRLLGRRQR